MRVNKKHLAKIFRQGVFKFRVRAMLSIIDIKKRIEGSSGKMIAIDLTCGVFLKHSGNIKERLLYSCGGFNTLLLRNVRSASRLLI